MAILGYRVAMAGGRGQFVAVVDRHLVVVVGQHSCRAQPGDAGPDDDRVFALHGFAGLSHAVYVPCCNRG